MDDFQTHFQANLLHVSFKVLWYSSKSQHFLFYFFFNIFIVIIINITIIITIVIIIIIIIIIIIHSLISVCYY